MSHFDDIWPGIVNGLATLGFLSLLAAGGVCFIMAKQALEDKLEERKALRKVHEEQRTTRDEAAAAIKEVEAILGLERH